MNTNQLNQTIEQKMRAAGVTSPTIQAFLRAVNQVASGERGMLPESMVEPVTTLPRLEEIKLESADFEIREKLVVIKLNGGLGTSMGLERAKSLIQVKGEQTFLDLIARQVLHLRQGRRNPAFYLMNSFTTQQDTLDYLGKYSQLGHPLDFLQSKVPKIDAKTFEPIEWTEQPELEWCPPGHGDLYPSLAGCGLLDDLLARGVVYAFVSNSDNLGATVDLKLAEFFAHSELSFLMEVAERTAADKKGGHLARSQKTKRLLLRESAQCRPEDENSFQDVGRHRFFNTNNLWIRLDHLKNELERQGGSLPLPLITNSKTVDPKIAESPKVLQLESAMGAAIECFEKAGAIVVPRTRFAPVKTTSDLLVIRSDAYRISEDHQLFLTPLRGGKAPVVELDTKHYKVMADFDKGFAAGVPSLQECDSLKVVGPLEFSANVICQGKVEFVNGSNNRKAVLPGTYSNQRVTLG